MEETFAQELTGHVDDGVADGLKTQVGLSVSSRRWWETGK